MRYLPVLLLFLALCFFILDKRTGQTIAIVLSLAAFLVVFSEMKSAPKRYTPSTSDDGDDDDESHSSSKPYPKSSVNFVKTTVSAWKRTKRTGNKILDLNRKEVPKDEDEE